MWYKNQISHNLSVLGILFLFCIVCVYVLSSTFPSDYFVRMKYETELPQISIWPKDGDDDDRIEQQLILGYALADYLQKYNKSSSHRTKVILVAEPHRLYEPYVAGSQVFSKNCPVTNCLVTNDRKTFKKTADALILRRLRAKDIRPFQPKPRKQVFHTAKWLSLFRKFPTIISVSL